MHIYILSDWFQILHSAQARDFFPGGHKPEVEGQRWRSTKITTSKSTIVHLVCVIIMYTIYEMYKDVALSCSSYAIFLECRGRVCSCRLLLLIFFLKRSARGGSAPPIILGYDMLQPIIRFSHCHVYLDNCSCPIELYSLWFFLYYLWEAQQFSTYTRTPQTKHLS